MSISTSCPTCGHTVKTPDQMAGKSLKCIRCNDSYTIRLASGPGGSIPKNHLDKSLPSNGAVQAAFWLGLASITLGLTAGVFGFFRATSDYSHSLVWLGILLGSGSIVLAVVREECGFTFPYSGTVISLIALALLSFGISAPGRQGPGFGMGGPPTGQAGGNNRGPGNGMDKGQANWKGGPGGNPQGADKGKRGRQGGQGVAPPQQ